jgi:ribonuclease HI
MLDKASGKVYYALGKSPRACIRATAKINVWTVDEFMDRDICTIACEIEGRLTYLASAYLDINFPVRNPRMEALVNRCEALAIPLILGMDSNSHSPLWGCREANARGEELENMITEKNLIVANTGDTSTFVTSRSESIIDVTLMNLEAALHLNLRDWKVDDGVSFSDHRYITFSLGKYVPQKRVYRNLAKANWDLFREKLGILNCADIRIDGGNLDECAEQLEKRIGDALEAACPARPALDRRPMSWWTNELEKLRQELKTSGYKKGTGPNAYAEFGAKLFLYQKAIRKAKQESWRKFCSEAESAKDVSSRIRLLAPKTQPGIGLIKRDGVYTHTPQEALDTLMDQHFPESVPAEEEEVLSQSKRNIWDGVEDFVTMSKVKLAFASFGPKKAAGPDGLQPKILQNLDEGMIEYISHIYKTALRTGYTPRVWRRMSVVFLPKPGKDDYGVAKAFRPITLSNFLLKGMERIVQWYINEYHIKEPLYAQFAYTTGLSTETALSEVVDHIEKAILRKEKALVVSLDCSGAFSEISFDSAARAMEEKGIPETIVRWYDRILKERRVEADLQGTKNVRRPKKGSPQGGVLSPLIWNLIMDTLLTKFKIKAVKAVGYADDIIMVLTGTDPGTMVELMQQALTMVLEWGKENGLTFNPTKTVAVTFTKATKEPEWKELKMGEKTIMYSKSMKYLGVTLSKRLTWTEHLKERVSKGMKVMNMAKALVGQTWGLSSEKLMWIYKAMVRPIVTYGALVWAKSIIKTTKKSLDRLQRLTLLSISHAMRSTPTAGMEVILGLSPLDLYAEAEAMKARVRTRRSLKDRWDGLGSLKGHRRHWDDMLRGVCPKALPLDLVTRTRNWEERKVVKNPDVVIYTDGSKEEGAAGFGWAAAAKDQVIAEESGYLGEECTVFQTEVCAISDSLLWLLSNPHKLRGKKDFLIRSDSLAAIQAIYSTTVESKIVLECVEALKETNKTLNVAVEWVKGHADCTGNEYADYLAKLGRTRVEAGAEPWMAVPISFIKKRVEDLKIRRWQKRWEQSKDCRITKLFFPDVGEKKCKKLVKLSSDSINLLFQAGTGHGLFADHLVKWKEELDNICKLCLEEEESSTHLWTDCPALECERRQAVATIQRQPFIDSFENGIISFFRIKAIKDAMRLNSQATESVPL